MMFHHGTQDRHDTQAHQARPFLFMSGNCGYPGDTGNACSVCGRPGVVVIRVAVCSARLEANASGVTIVQSQQVSVSSRFGQPTGRSVGSRVQRFTSKGDRRRKQVSALEHAAMSQNAKNPIV